MEIALMPKYLTTKEIAERINMDHSQVRRAIAHGWLKATKMGHTSLVTERNLQKWLDEGKRVYPNKKRKENE